MHGLLSKIVVKLKLCDYQCTNVRFVKLSNRIESKNRFVSVNLIESNFPRIGMLYILDWFPFIRLLHN